MVTTPDDNKRLTQRHSASQKVLILFLVILSMTAVVGAQTTLTFYDDFETDTVGTTPGGWSDGMIVEDGLNQFQSMDLGGSTTADWTDGPVTTNQGGQYQALIKASGGATTFGLRDGEGNETRIRLEPTAGDVVLNVRDDGSLSSTDTTIGDFQGDWYRYRVVMNGTHVVATFWDASQSNPTIHTLTRSSQSVESTDNTFDVETSSNGQATVDWIGSTGADARLTGTVLDDDTNQPISGVTITANQSGTVVNTATTGPNGEYQMGLDNGTYTVTAEKPGYFNRTEEVTVVGDTVQDFRLTNRTSGLNLKVRPFVEHGQTVPYTVTATITNETTGEEERTDVTDDTVVISSNPGVVSVNGFNNEIVGTSDTSVNERITLTAEYDHEDLDRTLTDSQNVTVANATVNNLDILPPMTRWTATLRGGTESNPNDKTIMILLIAVGAGIVASKWASSFAGIAGVTIIMEMGWIMGHVSDGVAIVTVFIALFIGLNVAGNVDYTVRR